jgi:hypothetical protein
MLRECERLVQHAPAKQSAVRTDYMLLVYALLAGDARAVDSATRRAPGLAPTIEDFMWLKLTAVRACGATGASGLGGVAAGAGGAGSAPGESRAAGFVWVVGWLTTALSSSFSSQLPCSTDATKSTDVFHHPSIRPRPPPIPHQNSVPPVRPPGRAQPVAG